MAFLAEPASGSRFSIEENVLRTVAGWVEQETQLAVNQLLRFIRQMMMPESQKALITRQSVLAWLGFSNPEGIYPCPSEIQKVRVLVSRTIASDAVQNILSGEQFICMHGHGGCGKTTVLQEVEALLPKDSCMVVFDCYGGGRYLDAGAYRHRPKDAFLHLSNDLAAKLRVPLLLTQRSDVDFARSFRARLNMAAQAVAASGSQALLVIAVDAADNSITAARSRVPPDPSFVTDFVSFESLPTNVRLIVTARTGRLDQLGLPDDFKFLKVDGFTLPETGGHVRTVLSDVPDAWIDDFHHFSQGNPRVQAYALKYGGANPERVLDYLRPNGKGLSEVFDERLRSAQQRGGDRIALDEYCRVLSILPRPVPLSALSAISGLTVENVRDICADLAPGVRLMDQNVGFADEDFEDFIRLRVEDSLTTVRTRAAEWFMEQRKSDLYAAIHVATVLYDAARGRNYWKLWLQRLNRSQLATL